MKVAFKSLIAAAAFMAAGAASAATVTITVGNTVYKGVKLNGSETLNFSVDAIGAFDTYMASLASYGPGVATSTKDTDGFYTSASVSAPVASLNVEDTTDQAVSVAASGGLTMTLPWRKAISSGGSLTISDLNVDLANKVVYATLIGANGVGTLSNVPLWTFDTQAGNTTVVPAGGGSGNVTFSVSGLHLTTEGTNRVAASLALGPLGKGVLNSLPDFGSISFSLDAVRELPICSVSLKTTGKNQVLFNTEVTVTNHSSNATTGWQVSWNYNKPTLLIAPKNAKLTDKGLKRYTAKPVAGNTVIAAGGSTTFSFKGHANDGAPVLSDLAATVGGAACAVTQAP